MNLLEQSDNAKRQADLLIKQSGVLNILSGYGEVKIGGSHALNAMLRPDLDFFVVTDAHNWEKVLQLNDALMRLKYFRIIAFENWLDFRVGTPDDGMRGYYFKLVALIEDVRWKCDVWLITPDQDKSSIYTETFKKLLITEQQRAQILFLKDHFKQGGKYIPGVDGKMIYTAVLKEHIHNIDDFIKFAKPG